MKNKRNEETDLIDLEPSGYVCPECDAMMEFEGYGESTLCCPSCGYSTDVDHYGYTDEEYADMEADITRENYENLRKYDPLMAEIMDELAEDDEDEW